MSACECGRPLREDEKQCPACASKKSHGRKRIVEVASGVLALGAGIVIWVLTGGKGGK